MSSRRDERPVRATARKKRSRREESSDDEEEQAAAAPRRKTRGRPRKTPKRPPQEKQLEKWGDYTLKYQDDQSGNRYIHPTALRFTLGIVEDLARDSTDTVSKSLKDDGEMVSEK